MTLCAVIQAQDGRNAHRLPDDGENSEQRQAKGDEYDNEHVARVHAEKAGGKWIGDAKKGKRDLDAEDADETDEQGDDAVFDQESGDDVMLGIADSFEDADFKASVKHGE